ncbi:kinase-like domain-containing protein [Mycena leptocephala]|nr:kinase-like domain-containing protein [Mycena leptocephala]
MTCNFLARYDTVQVIGHGAFDIVRKVRRKSDGMIFARKELNFWRMTERDYKQIVAERYLDHEAGILYIIMEYCGGGDLSMIFNRAVKRSTPIPEDTIWAYFMQILLALDHCHAAEGDNGKVQIVHRDLKPENIFLDGANSVKLGDFGLSKALLVQGFSTTYTGPATPLYMSPELMQGTAYDSKTDIWSLGCLLYELCALKHPFHDAKTEVELKSFVRNGRIPPLPPGYSQAIGAVIKSMVDVNPTTRPSAAQLLQHERIKFAAKLALKEKESRIIATIQDKEAQINLLCELGETPRHRRNN